MFIYYIYAYLREDGSPYYIGKGKGNRAFSHTHKVKVPPLSRIIFMEKNLSNIGACALERRYIRWYGRKCNNTGMLRNLTEGGEGNTAKRSDEWCQNHSEKLRGRKLEPDHIAKLKIIDRSYMKTEEYRRKISEAKKGKPNLKLKNRIVSEETRDKIRKTKLLRKMVTPNLTHDPGIIPIVT